MTLNDILRPKDKEQLLKEYSIDIISKHLFYFHKSRLLDIGVLLYGGDDEEEVCSIVNYNNTMPDSDDIAEIVYDRPIDVGLALGGFINVDYFLENASDKFKEDNPGFIKGLQLSGNERGLSGMNFFDNYNTYCKGKKL